MARMNLGSHGGYHHPHARVTVLAHFDSLKTVQTEDSLQAHPACLGISWNGRPSMEYCWTSGWSCDSKPTLPQKILKQISVVELAISKLFTSLWGEKVSKLSFFLGCGRVWDVLTPMPDLHQTDSWTRWFTKSAAKIRLYFFFSWKAVTFWKRQWNMANGVFIVLLLHLYFQYLKPTWDTPCFFSNSKRLKQIAKAPLLMNPANRLQKSRGFLPEIKKEINEKKRPKFQWNSQMLLANWGTSNSTEHPAPYKLFEGHVSCWDKYRESKWIFNFCANCVADCSAPSDFYFASLEIWICFLGAAVVPCQHVCKKGALLILVEMKCKFCEQSYLSEKKMYNCWGNITSHI